MGQQCDLDNRETIDEGDNADIWSHDSGGGRWERTSVGVCGPVEKKRVGVFHNRENVVKISEKQRLTHKKKNGSRT